MHILTAAQIRELEQGMIAKKPNAGLQLMEYAAEKFYFEIVNQEEISSFTIICGKGNNGGDGLAVARLLAERPFKIKVIIVNHSDSPSAGFTANLNRLAKTTVKVSEVKSLPAIPAHDLVIDALLGTGLSRPLTGLLADVVKQINTLPNRVVSIDVPSGLFCEDNTTNDRNAIIQADKTITFHCVKLGFLFAENAPFVGDIKVLDIGLQEANANILCNEVLVSVEFATTLLRQRPHFSHKGNFGHALLVAGAYGHLGAAVMASKACMRSGAGLLTAHVPSKGVDVMQVAVPEAMCSIDDDTNFITMLPKLDVYSAIGMGPGIGTNANTAKVLKRVLQDCKVPLILDADALNLLSENKTWLAFLPPNTVLTPHPKEFDRLAGTTASGYERWQKQREFAIKYKCIVVLKGAYTSICNPAGQTFFNSTGNPGMATAGSGDVLTGIILGLLAQGYGATEACVLGVFVHGLSGDIAEKKHGQQALIAGDITEGLGKAFRQLTI